MATIILNHRLAAAGDTQVIECLGGLKPGVVATDPLGTTPATFAVTALSATAYSYLTHSFVADAATAGEVRTALAQVIKELLRKKILEGTYTL